jgi:hypothetical protein
MAILCRFVGAGIYFLDQNRRGMILAGRKFPGKNLLRSGVLGNTVGFGTTLALIHNKSIVKPNM